MTIRTTLVRRDPPETRWLAECTLPDGTTVRRRAGSKQAAEDAVRDALPPSAHHHDTPVSCATLDKSLPRP